MLSRTALTTSLLIAFSAPVFAQDATRGQAAFSQCASCHNVISPSGEVLAGRASVRTGPNLYGIVGRQAGSVDGFRYGTALAGLGASGYAWTQDDIAAYLQNPTQVLRSLTGDNRARSQMSFQVRSPETAADIAAFLASFSPTAQTDDTTENVPSDTPSDHMDIPSDVTQGVEDTGDDLIQNQIPVAEPTPTEETLDTTEPQIESVIEDEANTNTTATQTAVSETPTRDLNNTTENTASTLSNAAVNATGDGRTVRSGDAANSAAQAFEAWIRDVERRLEALENR